MNLPKGKPELVDKPPKKTVGEMLLEVVEQLKNSDLKMFYIKEEEQIYFCDDKFCLNKLTFENNTKVWTALYSDCSAELKKSID